MARRGAKSTRSKPGDVVIAVPAATLRWEDLIGRKPTIKDAFEINKQSREMAKAAAFNVLARQEARAKAAREKRKQPAWHADVAKRIKGKRSSNSRLAEHIVEAWAREDDDAARAAARRGESYTPPARPSVSAVRQAIPRIRISSKKYF
jgi:hypothetical protein